MKTLIAVPCMDMVAAPFAQSLSALNKQGDCIISFLIGSLIYQSRDNLAIQAIKEQCDYVMWFDSDMIFPPNTLMKMLDHMKDGRDIVTGLYFRRRNPFTPVLFSKLEETEDGACSWADYNDYPKNGVFEIAGCGFGCCMVKTEVFAELLGKYGSCFTPFGGISEDLAFSMRARESGYKIWCDSTIKCGHVGQVIVNENVYESTK